MVEYVEQSYGLALQLSPRYHRIELLPRCNYLSDIDEITTRLGFTYIEIRAIISNNISWIQRAIVSIPMCLGSHPFVGVKLGAR